MESEKSTNVFLEDLTEEEFDAILKFSKLPPEKREQVLGAIEELSPKE